MRLPLAALTLVLLVPLATAQDRVRFDTAIHLDGWEEAYFSDWSDLYDFEPFELEDGKELLAGEVQTLRRRWLAEVERVRAKVATLQSDPYAAGIFRLEKALRPHPFLSRIDYEVIERPPLAFVVQAPPKENPTYAARIVNEYTRLFGELEKRFATELAGPLELARRENTAVLPVVVLATAGDATNYATTMRAHFHYRGGGWWDAKLRGPVLYETPFTNARSAFDRTYAALHGFAHSLLYAHASSNRHDWQSFAFEGLCDYLANTHPFKRPPTYGGPDAPPPGAFQHFILGAGDAATRHAHAWPLHEAVQRSSYSLVYTSVVKRSNAQRTEEPAYGVALYGYQRVAALWTHFLLAGPGSAWRDRWLAYVKAELSGAKGASELSKTIGEDAGKDLLRKLLLWTIDEHRRLYPEVALHQPTVLGLTPVATASTPAAGGTTNASSATATAEPATLALDVLPANVRFAEAIWNARAGRVSAARESLTSLIETIDVERFRERVRRELERLDAWIALRDAWLAQLAASGDMLSWTDAEGRNKGRVQEYANGRIVADVRKRGTVRIPVESIDAVALARQVDGAARDAAASWVRIYPYVLAGDTKWKRLLKGADPATTELRADAEADYPERMREGEAAALLRIIDGTETPRSPAEGRDLLTHVERVRDEYMAFEFVAERRAALRARAGAAYALMFEELGLDEALNGKVERIGDDRLKVSYDFSDPQQLDDFPQSDYCPTLREIYPELKGKDDRALAVRGGELRGLGSDMRRWAFGFAAPMTITYDMAVQDTTVPKAMSWYFAVGFCDDGDEHFVLSRNRKDLDVWEEDTHRTSEAQNRYTAAFGRFSPVTLIHDGTTVEMRTKQKEEKKIDAGKRRSGGVFLWLHTDFEIRVRSLTLEGVVDPASMERLRASWVERQLAAF